MILDLVSPDLQFEAGEDYFKTILSGLLDEQNVPENVPEIDRQNQTKITLQPEHPGSESYRHFCPFHHDLSSI